MDPFKGSRGSLSRSKPAKQPSLALACSRVSVGCFPDSTVLTARCANALVSHEGAPRT
jgi:hypothetical protein